jgi:hypothetical protein
LTGAGAIALSAASLTLAKAEITRTNAALRSLDPIIAAPAPAALPRAAPVRQALLAQCADGADLMTQHAAQALCLTLARAEAARQPDMALTVVAMAALVPGGEVGGPAETLAALDIPPGPQAAPAR